MEARGASLFDKYGCLNSSPRPNHLPGGFLQKCTPIGQNFCSRIFRRSVRIFVAKLMGVRFCRPCGETRCHHGPFLGPALLAPRPVQNAKTFWSLSMPRPNHWPGGFRQKCTPIGQNLCSGNFRRSVKTFVVGFSADRIGFL